MNTPDEVTETVLKSVSTLEYFSRTITEWMVAAVTEDRKQHESISAFSVWLAWSCDNTDEHPDNEHNIEEVEQQLTDVPEVGTAVCPQCGCDMLLSPNVRIR